MTSSLTQSVSNASRARRAVRTASRAVKQPAVLGRSCTPAASSTSTNEPRALGSMRRSAAVTSSPPLPWMAAASASSERKPPVPSSRREVSSRPPMVKVSCSVTATASASLYRAQDLDPRAVAQLAPLPLAARYDLGVDRHGDAALPALERERGQRALDRGARLELPRLAVDEDVHAATPEKRAGSHAAAHSGRPSPASTATTACAVTSASRIPLR